MTSSPPATVLCRAGSSRFPPHMVLLVLAALLLAAAPLPTRSSSHGDAAALEPILTFCSGHGQSSSSPAVTSGDEFAAFVDALCAGVHGAAHMSHNMSSHVAGNLMYGVAQCRPDVPAADCAACLAAASSRLVAGSSAACAVWYDACFLRYNDRDPSRFNEDEYTAAVFNATRAVPQHRNGKAVVRRLLAVLGNTTTSSHGCRGVGAGTAAARGGGMVYGLTRCAAGTSCDDCRRCLRRAVAAVGRAYNGSAGMQVLRLSCMARYESHPFYNGRSLQTAAVRSGASSTVSSAPPPSSRFGAIGATINFPGGGSSPIIPPATTIGQNGNGTAVAPTAPPAVLALPPVLPAPIPTQDDQDQVDAPPATMLCMARSSRFPPHMMVLLVLAALLLAAPRPTRSLSHGDAAALQPVLTFCSVHGQSPNLTSSFSAAVTSGDDFAAFVAAVCAGVHGAADMSHNMSSHVAGKLMYGVAQCRPDVSAADCAACLAAASSRLVAGRAACAAASAVWHDACFLRYSDHDPGRFREDEYTATVFNATTALPSHRNGKAVVRRLLAATGNRTTSSHMCRGVGAGTAGGGMVYGLTRCAAGTSCDDCRRCLRGAVAAVGRAYNGSAGMKVLRLSCMARYESYPFYNTASLQQKQPCTGSCRAGGDGTPLQYVPVTDAWPLAPRISDSAAEGRIAEELAFNMSAPPPAATTTPAPAPPGAQTGPPPSPPAAENPPPPPTALHHAANISHAAPPFPAATPPPGSSMEHRSPSLSHEMETQKTHKVPIMLIIPIATGVVVAIVILVLIWHRRRKPLVQLGHVEEPDGMQGKKIYDQKDEQLGMEEEDMDGDITTCQSYSYQVLEAATCHFSNRNKLGSGGFGTVYKGTLENGKEVAVKKLRDSKRNLQELEREIYIVANLCHKNLVRFLGYCLEDEGKFLVYEYVPNNSLEKFWYKACFHSQKLEWDAWFNIIKGVARGLQFLHNKGIIHRDLKPHNVLLDENFNPKIADFDLMRMYNKEKTHESTEKIAGTFGYMAPECTSGRKFLLSIKSDVYSYGVLVLEIITGHKIYTFEGQNSEGLVEYVWKHWTEKRAGDIIDSDLGVDGQEHALRQALRCVHVALLCVQSDRARRPTMGQVLAMLSNDDGIMELQEPSLPGYVVFRATAVSGPVRLSCLGCR